VYPAPRCKVKVIHYVLDCRSTEKSRRFSKTVPHRSDWLDWRGKHFFDVSVILHTLPPVGVIDWSCQLRDKVNDADFLINKVMNTEAEE